MLHVRTLSAILALVMCAAIAVPATAGITRLEITSNVPYGSFKSGEFVRLDGRVTGELPAFEPVPGIARAPKNARGMVRYSAPFVLIMPREKGAGNGALLIDVPNRGRAIAHHLYNSPRDPFLPLGSFAAGNGFLQDHGFAVAMLQWELGQGIELPAFAEADGTLRYAEGAGLSAIRDFADFLRHAAQDSLGTPNPLASRIDRTLAIGYSQTARLLKTLLIEGFNETAGRRVFDGMHINASASGIANVLATGAGPESSTFFTPRFTHPEFRGVTEEPLTYTGIAARAATWGQAAPKLLVTNMTTDYYSIRASLARTGAHGTADLPIPPMVRIYDVAGGSHGRAVKSTCEFPPGRLDFFPVMRATLLNLDRWVRDGAEPPPDRLMPLEPRQGDKSVLQAPSHMPEAIVQVPVRDADGNALGGVRLPDMEAPLGTHGAQNLPLTDRACNLNAAYIAFAKSSIRARYKSRDDYVERIRAAAQRLVAERFLTEADAQEIVRAAQSATEF